MSVASVVTNDGTDTTLTVAVPNIPVTVFVLIFQINWVLVVMRGSVIVDLTVKTGGNVELYCVTTIEVVNA